MAGLIEIGQNRRGNDSRNTIGVPVGRTQQAPLLCT